MKHTIHYITCILILFMLNMPMIAAEKKRCLSGRKEATTKFSKKRDPKRRFTFSLKEVTPKPPAKDLTFYSKFVMIETLGKPKFLQRLIIPVDKFNPKEQTIVTIQSNEIDKYPYLVTARCFRPKGNPVFHAIPGTPKEEGKAIATPSTHYGYPLPTYAKAPVIVAPAPTFIMPTLSNVLDDSPYTLMPSTPKRATLPSPESPLLMTSSFSGLGVSLLSPKTLKSDEDVSDPESSFSKASIIRRSRRHSSIRRSREFEQLTDLRF